MTNYSRVEYPGLTGSAGSFVIPFRVLNPEDVTVYLDGELVSPSLYNVDGSGLTFRSDSFPNGDLIITRSTSLDKAEVRFNRSSQIRAADLNRSLDQALFAVQEVVDGFAGIGITLDPVGGYVAPKEVVGLGEVDNTSDLNKPISTATQAALNAKLDASAFDPSNIYQIVVTASGGAAGINARTLEGETAASLKDWRQQTNKPSAYPPSPHVHDASQITSGEFAAARIPESGVTRHQDKLAINYGQVKGAPPGSLGEVPEDDGSLYLRTQGDWVLFNPDAKADVSYVQAESARLEDVISSKADAGHVHVENLDPNTPYNLTPQGVYAIQTAGGLWPVELSAGLHVQHSIFRQFQLSVSNDELTFRRGHSSNTDGVGTGWSPWRYVWHDGNFDPAKTSGALSVITADTTLDASEAVRANPIYIDAAVTVTVPPATVGWTQGVHVARGVTATFDLSANTVRDKDGNVFDLTAPNNTVTGPAYLELACRTTEELEIWT